MKLNIPVRFKNVWFWVGLIGTILTAMNVEPAMLTSWPLVWEAIMNLISNPFQIGCVIIAIIGVVVDPTTKGIGDSSLAMTYKKPK